MALPCVPAKQTVKIKIIIEKFENVTRGFSNNGLFERAQAWLTFIFSIYHELFVLHIVNV